MIQQQKYFSKFNNNQSFTLLSSSIDYILKSKRFSGSLLQHDESIFKCALSYFYLKVQSHDLVMWGHSTLFSISISGSSNCLTKFYYFTSIHHCFHSKENGHYTILHYICSYKFFGVFTDPILLHIVTHQGIFFAIVIIFLIALLLFNGNKVQQQLCVYILYCILIFILFVADVCNTCKLFDIKKKKQCFYLK